MGKSDSGKPRYLLVEVTTVIDIMSHPVASHESMSQSYCDVLVNMNPGQEGDIDDRRLQIVEHAMDIASACISAYFGDNADVLEVVSSLSDLYEYGAEMHYVDSWREIEVSRWVNSAGRHMKYYLNDIEFDGESSFPHILHVLWNCVTIIYLVRAGNDI